MTHPTDKAIALSTLQATIATITPTDAVHLGFRVPWMTTEPEDTNWSAELTCGAGVGTGWLILNISYADGEQTYEVVDMTEFVADWIHAARARRDGAT